MTISEHIADCSENQQKLTKYIDEILDNYEPEYDNLLKEILELKNNYEKLEKDFANLL